MLEPGSRRILVATGNGPFNGRTDWGDSVLELTPDASRLLHNWTPRNQAELNSNDGDLGSTSPALLPAVHGYRLAVQGGKQGILSLLNLNRLNGTRGGAGPRTGGELQDISSPGGDQVFSAPAVWSHPGGPFVFVADGSGTAAYVLRVNGRPRLVTVWQNGTAGTSPIIAGGLLYVYDENGGTAERLSARERPPRGVARCRGRPLEQPGRGRRPGDPADRERQRPLDQRRDLHLPPARALAELAGEWREPGGR